MSALLSGWVWSQPLTVLLLAGALHPLVAAETAAPIPVLTNLARLRQLVGESRRQVCSFELEGVVRAARPAEGLLFLQDDSGAEVLEADWGDGLPEPGQRVRLQVANGSVTATDFCLRLSRGPIAGNDSCHPMLENSGEIFLTAGRHPLRVAWFNWIEGFGLELDYAGPDLPRQRVPEAKLFRSEAEPRTGRTNLVSGLDYRCFEGDWTRLPDFTRLTPVKRGTIPTFDIGARTRDEHVGLEFTGWLDVGRDGLYKFFVTSDDGCQLYLPEAAPRLAVIGSAPLPLARRLTGGQALAAEETASQWAEVEGEVAFVTRRGAVVELELIFGGSRLPVKVLDATGEAPAYFLRSRIRVAGVCQAATTEDGRILAGALVVPDWSHVQVLEVSPDHWPAFRLVNASRLLPTDFSAVPSAVRLQGTLREGPPGQPWLIEDETGAVPVELLMPLPGDSTGVVDVLAYYYQGDSAVRLRQGVFRARAEKSAEELRELPLLTTAEQVQRLNREEAARQYPVRIKGVLTWVSSDFWAVVIQDATRAIYVRNNGRWPLDWPQLGEYWEVQGVSDPADFSPIVQARDARRLGLGRLPEPLHPTRDQLLSGTLDAQYVEVQGIVTDVEGERVTLLTRSGRLTLALFDHRPPPAKSLENALIRVRGCLFPQWDPETHRVRVHLPMRMGSTVLTVDEAAPLDPFRTARKSAAQLLAFDTEAGAFQRVRVAGQIVHERAGTFFLMDGANGLRFLPKEPVKFQPGDLVEVVGFPELGGPAPVLHETVARET